MKVKDFVPPIILQLCRKSSMKEYDSFGSALKDSDTYEDPAIIEVVSSKTRGYRDFLASDTGQHASINRQTAQNMFVISYVHSDRPVDVLELGGACGASYYELNHFLPERIGQWFIVETPAMAVAGKEIFQDDKIKFFDTFSAAVSGLKNPDLIIAQGVLQYTSNPIQMLDDLLDLGFKYMYITRTTVSDRTERPIITKQVTNLSDHGPGMPFPEGLTDRQTSQPLTIIPFESISSRISVDYDVVFSFKEGGSRKVLIGSRTVATREVGFLIEKR
jgi:putative methyltransferase (TIGR04325 family)